MRTPRKLIEVCCLLTMPLFQSCALLAAEPVNSPEVEVTIVEGSQYQLCEDYAAELQEHRATTRKYCGVAIPLENPDYVLMSWENIDPAENMDLVKTMYYWLDFGSEVGDEFYRRQMIDLSEIDEEILALYWPKAEAQVLTLIQQGDVELQRSRFDIDFDGVREDVYRMTPLARTAAARPPQLEPTHQIGIGGSCENFGLPGATKQYVYYTPTADVPNAERGPFIRRLLDVSDFFSWRGRIYWGRGEGNVFEPHDGDFPNVRQVCSMTSKVIGD
jgi:hypothetical protein